MVIVQVLGRLPDQINSVNTQGCTCIIIPCCEMEPLCHALPCRKLKGRQKIQTDVHLAELMILAGRILSSLNKRIHKMGSSNSAPTVGPVGSKEQNVL